MLGNLVCRQLLTTRAEENRVASEQKKTVSKESLQFWSGQFYAVKQWTFMLGGMSLPTHVILSLCMGR
jgi:hypothetical protein